MRRISVAAGAFSAVAIALAAVLVLRGQGSDGAQDGITASHGPGAGGVAHEVAEHLAAAFNELPQHPDAVPEDGVESRLGTMEGGDDVWAIFFVPASPEDVISFYQRELPARGWQISGVPETRVLEKDKDTWVSVELVSTQDDRALVITATTPSKVPERGETQLFIQLRE